MNTPTKNTPSENGMLESKEAAQASDQTTELQTMYEELCTTLDGVMPIEIFDMLKQVQPLEAAIKLLWEYGGRIRANNPEIDLKGEYSYPEEVNELNETIGDFSFSIAPSPFIAIAQAASGNIDADEEIIQACELKDYVPIIIKQNDEVKRICLIDYASRKLEMPMGSLFNISIDMKGDPSEQSNAIAKGLKELESHLDALKQHIEEPPQLFASCEEEEAIRTWCARHTYSVIGIFRASMDRYF